MGMLSGMGRHDLDGAGNSGSSGGDGEIPDGGVTTAKLANGAATTPKIGEGAVTSSKIGAGAVMAAAIAAGAVGTSAIAEGSITSALLAPGVGGGATALIIGAPKQVWTIGGQSNWLSSGHISAAGYQGRPDEYGEEIPVAGIYEVSPGPSDSPRYSPAAGKLRQLEYIGANQNNPDGNSMPFHFAKRYKELNPGLESLVIVNRAAGATGFNDNDWNPGDPEYNAALAETQQILEDEPEHEWTGMIWGGGENDANDRISKAAFKTAVLGMWTAFKGAMGEEGINGVLVLPSMVTEWRNSTTSSGGEDVTPAHKDAIHQGMIELAAEHDDIIFVDLDAVTEPETDNIIHWGNRNIRAGGKEVGTDVTKKLFGLQRSGKMPEYRFQFDGTRFSNMADGGGLIHDQRLVLDDEFGMVLTTEDTPGSGTYSGFDAEIKVDQRHYTISMWVCPTVVPESNVVTFAVGGVNNGTLRWMGYGGARHGDYGATVSNWVGQLAADRWDLVTTTFDGTQFRSYLNGVERPNSPQTSNAAVMSGVGDVKLFQFPGLTTGTFKGRARDIVVLPYAMSGAGVANLAGV